MKKIIHFTLILSLASALLFWRLDATPFRVSDESLHVKAAQSIFQGGSWLIPTVDGKPYLNKPPLKMWITQIPLNILGESTFSYRVVDAVFGIGTILLTWYAGILIFNSSLVGLIAGCALLGCRYFLLYHCARNAVQDSALTFFITAAMLAGYQAIVLREKKIALLFWIFHGVFLAAGVLTKSVAGFLPFFLVVGFTLCYRTLWHKWERKTLRRMFEHLALSYFLVGIVLGTYLLALVNALPNALDQMLSNEVVKRFEQGLHNSGDFFFYLKGLFYYSAGPQPVLLALALLTGGYLFLKTRSKQLGFTLFWGIAPLVIYSLMDSRMPWYIVPTFPALALLIGYTVKHLLALISASNSSIEAKFSAHALVSVLVAMLVVHQYAQIITEIGLPPRPHLPNYQLNKFVQPKELYKILPYLGTGNFVSHAIPMQSVATELAKINTASAQSPAPILTYLPEKLAQHESIYFEMLKPRPRELTQIKDLNNQRYSALVVPSKNLNEVLELTPTKPLGYLPLPPENRFSQFDWHRRLTPLVVLFWAPGGKQQSVFDFTELELKSLYGLHPPEKTKQGFSFQRSKGARSAFTVTLDYVFSQHGGELELSLGLISALKTGQVLELSLRLNDQDLGKVAPTSKQVSAFKFLAPAPMFNSGVNLLTVEYSFWDGAEISPSQNLIIWDSVTFKPSFLK
ncbi:glycosyltransferase family 39 protein [bacterium]|nr:glycosyltransferase family 39 protein [bacterium]